MQFHEKKIDLLDFTSFFFFQDFLKFSGSLSMRKRITYFLMPSIKDEVEQVDSLLTLWSLSIWIFKSLLWALNLSQSSFSIFCLALNSTCWLLYSSNIFSLFFQKDTMFDISTSKSRNPRTNSVYLPSFSLSWYKDRSWKNKWKWIKK